MRTLTGLTITTAILFVGTCAIAYQSGRHAGWREGFVQARSMVDPARAEAYTAGYNKARHDVALVWYTRCVEDAQQEGIRHPIWCGPQGGEMREYLGFMNRWPDEMP